MLCLSLRKGDSTVFFGPPRWSEVDGADLTAEQVKARLAGRKVCVLVHGYNVEDAFDAYARIESHLEHRNECGVQPWYDDVIGVAWPGSKLELAFWLARVRAGKAGRLLADALRLIDPAALDIEGHSLGCMVVLEALRAGLRVRNCLLTAAAVDHESIQQGQKYEAAVSRAQRVMVAYSQHDGVLRGAYRLGMWDSALGLTGPRNPALCASNVLAVDCSGSVREHSDYKRDRLFFTWWETWAR